MIILPLSLHFPCLNKAAPLIKQLLHSPGLPTADLSSSSMNSPFLNQTGTEILDEVLTLNSHYCTQCTPFTSYHHISQFSLLSEN